MLCEVISKHQPRQKFNKFIRTKVSHVESSMVESLMRPQYIMSDALHHK